MQSKVVQLNPSPKRIAHYLRLGQGCHRQLEELQDAGDLPFTRVVADASRINEQSDLVQALRKDGKEIVLDPNMAELSTIGGATGQARHLPWAKATTFWQAEDIDQSKLRSIAAAIAEMAVKNGCSAVHSPSHLLTSAKDPWLPIDTDAAAILRYELDQRGGQDISVDYVLSIRYADLRDSEARRVITSHVAQSQFDQLWLRIPGFGADCTGAMVRQYVSAVSDMLTQLGSPPVVADYAGGLPALAACAFGSVGGIAHGVAEKERFNPNSWTRPRPSTFGGRTQRIYAPKLDMYLTSAEFDQLWSVDGARSTLLCPDVCCGRGKSNMQDKRHILRQRAKQVAELDSIPEFARPEHVLHQQLETVGQTIRSFERIRGLSKFPKIQEKLAKRSAAIDRFSRQLRELTELRGMLERSANPPHRGLPVLASNRGVKNP